MPPIPTLAHAATPAAVSVDLAVQLLREALHIADRAVIADIESEAVAHVDDAGHRWYDTRPMLDPREQPDDVIEMMRQALGYARGRGIVAAHPEQPHLVRVLRAT